MDPNFWLVLAYISLGGLVFLNIHSLIKRREKERDTKNRDALIKVILEGHITSVEWGCDYTKASNGRVGIGYCVFEGTNWKYLAQEGSCEMERAPHGFVPYEIRRLIHIPNLKSVLDSVAFHFMMHNTMHDKKYSAWYNGSGEGAVKLHTDE